MTRTPSLEYWQSPKDGQWYWHLKGANGKVVCHGEGHPTKAKAIRAARSIEPISSYVEYGLVGKWRGVSHYDYIVTERKPKVEKVKK